jgi:hypothetical protein
VTLPLLISGNDVMAYPSCVPTEMLSRVFAIQM